MFPQMHQPKLIFGTTKWCVRKPCTKKSSTGCGEEKWPHPLLQNFPDSVYWCQVAIHFNSLLILLSTRGRVQGLAKRSVFLCEGDPCKVFNNHKWPLNSAFFSLKSHNHVYVTQSNLNPLSKHDTVQKPKVFHMIPQSTARSKFIKA